MKIRVFFYRELELHLFNLCSFQIRWFYIYNFKHFLTLHNLHLPTYMVLILIPSAHILTPPPHRESSCSHSDVSNCWSNVSSRISLSSRPSHTSSVAVEGVVLGVGACVGAGVVAGVGNGATQLYNYIHVYTYI